MNFSTLSRSLTCLAIFACTVPLCAQTVHVDVTPSKAIAFDPDKSMGSSIDILPAKDLEKVYSEPIIKESLSAGWGPITYRQNTELTYDAWHWNPNGVWSDPKNKSGYFVGNAEPKDFLRESFGYRLSHRGTTRSDSGQFESSRMTDGDPATYWKSNPYLSSKFTGEPDSANPQWVLIDFAFPARDRRDPDCVGQSICHQICRGILDGKRRYADKAPGRHVGQVS